MAATYLIDRKIIATGQLLGGMPDTGTPFVWKKAERHNPAEVAPAGGLKGLQDSIEAFEASARTDPGMRWIFDDHKRNGRFLRHALLEVDKIIESDQFAEHTRRFITTVQGLLQTFSSNLDSAYEPFKAALREEVLKLLKDFKPFQITRSTFQLDVEPSSIARSNFESALQIQEKLSWKLMSEHFVPTGAIVASFDPVYFRCWKRDAAIVFDEKLRENGHLNSDTQKLLDGYLDYDGLTRSHAKVLNFPGGFGEARCNIFAYLPPGDWGTPQFDGAALNAKAFADYGLKLLHQGEKAKAASWVYPIVKEYLEYLIHNDDKPCFDPWEEIQSKKHFWTEMAKGVALLRGAEFIRALEKANALEKTDDAARYVCSAQKIIRDVYAVFYEDKGNRILFPHKGVSNVGSAGKYSITDSQVLGALLLGKDVGYPIALDDPFALHTVASMVNDFQSKYKINHGFTERAVAIGRYPDDRYAGGNPWVIGTLWYGEYNYELALGFLKTGKINLLDGRKQDLERILEMPLPDTPVIVKSDPDFSKVVDRLCEQGDGQLKWVLEHTRNGKMAEQVHRDTGEPWNISDLAWSHQAFLSALRSRKELHPLLGTKA